MINSKVVRLYDVRGIVGETIFLDDFYHIGFRFCEIARQKLNINCNEKINIAVGYDMRIHSYDLFKKLCAGINNCGANVFNIGLVSSGALYNSVYNLDVVGGIIITASHNPKQYNGAKFILKDKVFTSEDVAKIATLQEKSYTTRGIVENKDITQVYLDKCLSVIDGNKNYNNIKIIWDCGNGATGKLVTELCKILNNKLNIINIILFAEMDGNFPNHEANPEKRKNMVQLIDAVKDENAEIGIAFDGDGDRIGLVDKSGKIIYGEHILLFLAKILLSDINKQNNKILIEQKCSPLVFEKIKELGGEPILCKTGHSIIKEKIKEKNAILGGEMSGHIFLAENYGVDDAIYAACKIINYLDSFNNFINKIHYFEFSQSFNINCSSHQEGKNKIDKVIDYMKNSNNMHGKITLIDGIRYEDPNLWFILRQSNTEPCLTVRIEANNKSDFDKINNLIKIL